MNKFLFDLNKKYSNVYIFDAFSVLCPNIKCKNKNNEKWIYSDEDHLTDYGSKMLTVEFDSLIKKITR